MYFARHKYILLKSGFILTTLILKKCLILDSVLVPELENSYQVLSKGQLKWIDKDEIIALPRQLLWGIMFGPSGLSDKIALETFHNNNE